MKTQGRTDKRIIKDLTKEIELLRAGIRGQTEGMAQLQRDNAALAKECTFLKERLERETLRHSVEFRNESLLASIARSKADHAEMALHKLIGHLDNFRRD